jgi:hypothetical protein
LPLSANARALMLDRAASFMFFGLDRPVPDEASMIATYPFYW